MIHKGVILAGGTGSRLYPATKVTNKHLLPIYDRPMIYFPLQTLISAGIKDILIVCGNEHVEDFIKLLADGREQGARLTYTVQTAAGGIAEALSLAEDFAGEENVAVILGDNIYEDSFSEVIRDFAGGAHIFLKEVPDAERFGVADIDEHKKVLRIEEKPQKPATNLAVTGLYLYDSTVFAKIRACGRSARGELEITDVNNLYIKEGVMKASIIHGHWTDAGTYESFYRASTLVRDLVLAQNA